jgi:hypothetical protein
MSEQPGPTGDKGGLNIGIDLDMNGNIRLEFGTPVAWLSMPPKEAFGLGRLLMRMGAAAQRAKIGGPKLGPKLAAHVRGERFIPTPPEPKLEES